MQFGYSLRAKTLFYLGYFVRKVFCLWFEVKRPRLRMFVYEMLYSAGKFINYNLLLPSPFKTDYVETKFGKFRIRPHTVDMSNVSPAFERGDINYLLRLIRRLRHENKKILFLDIGSDIGTYAITVGNCFRDYRDLHIMAFEPAVSSYSLLEENIALNGLEDKVRAYNIALYSEDGKELEFQFNPVTPGSSSLRPKGSQLAGADKVIARTIDPVIANEVKSYDTIVFKIDVEGVESKVLKGANMLLNSGKDIYLLVEDFVNPEIISYLEGMSTTFITKLTPYNSWWRL